MSEQTAEYLSSTQAAELLGLSRSWLDKRRVSGDGPPYYKVTPRRVLYARQELIDWVAGHRRRSTSEIQKAMSDQLDAKKEAAQ